jgi:hypothetical protein
MFTLLELITMRSSLDQIQIMGKDAKALASLQIKLEEYIQKEQEIQAQSNTRAKAK